MQHPGLDHARRRLPVPHARLHGGARVPGADAQGRVGAGSDRTEPSAQRNERDAAGQHAVVAVARTKASVERGEQLGLVLACDESPRLEPSDIGIVRLGLVRPGDEAQRDLGHRHHDDEQLGVAALRIGMYQRSEHQRRSRRALGIEDRQPATIVRRRHLPKRWRDRLDIKRGPRWAGDGGRGRLGARRGHGLRRRAFGHRVFQLARRRVAAQQPHRAILRARQRLLEPSHRAIADDGTQTICQRGPCPRRAMHEDAERDRQQDDRHGAPEPPAPPAVAGEDAVHRLVLGRTHRGPACV